MTALILPKGYENNKRDFKHFRKEDLNKRIEAFINENDDVRDPYYILVKISNDPLTPMQENMAISMYIKQRPPFLVGSMVFWVDNSRGLCSHLWTVSHEGKLRFNYKTAEELKGVLRASLS